MLAKPSNLAEPIGGWYASEKIDGMRCIWDGGVSRRYAIKDIPWANVGKGDEAVSTGLWSRYGNPIYAPDWFLDDLPPCFLDGELNAGRGEFQTTMSVCKRKCPDTLAWEKISFDVFGSPTPAQLFKSGQIKGTNFERVISLEDCLAFVKETGFLTQLDRQFKSFEEELHFLDLVLSVNCKLGFCKLHPQVCLPINDQEAWDVVNTMNKKILDGGGEGVMLRNPEQVWTPKRVSNLLKVKPHFDAEAVMIGATAGREGKTGRYHGMMGNLIVSYKPESDIIERVEFELSGFTDEERAISDPVLEAWCRDNPGKKMPEEMIVDGALQFNIGDTITFLYRELSKGAIPKDARYFRIRTSE